MEIIGRDIEVGFSTEAVRGTAESTVDKWERNVTASIVERAEHADDDTSRGALEDMENRRVIKKYIEGDLNGIVHADAIGYLYSSIYGKVVSAVVSGSVYDHEFTLKQNIEHQSLTVFAKDGGVQQVKFSNCVASTLEITATIDDYLRYTCKFNGSEATDDTESPSYDTEYDFIGKDITVKIADTEAGLVGATAIKAKSVSINHDQGSIRDHVLGSYSPDDNYNAKQSIEGEISLNFIDKTFKDLYLGDDAKYMSITIEGASDIGGGSKPTITYVFNKIKIKDWSREGANDDLVTETVGFKAYRNETDEEASKVTLRNLTSAYANVPSN
ncbi:MAG: phage tail tube protein [Candidatus Heimdallarchaeaceae archaeon]